MGVTLYEAALFQLLESENGDVGEDLRRRAENVTRIAEVKASGTIIGIDSGDLHSGISYTIAEDERGLYASVGSAAEHRGFHYPTWHDRNGRPWLSTALQDGFDL